MSSGLISTARFDGDAPLCNSDPPPLLSIGTPSTTKQRLVTSVKVVSPLIITLEPVNPDPVTRTQQPYLQVDWLRSFAAISSVALILVWNSQRFFVSFIQRMLQQPLQRDSDVLLSFYINSC
jgi:hypothetical protein